MKEIEDALKVDTSWLYEKILERDKELKEAIMSEPVHFPKIKPLTVEDLMS